MDVLFSISHNPHNLGVEIGCSLSIISPIVWLTFHMTHRPILIVQFAYDLNLDPP